MIENPMPEEEKIIKYIKKFFRLKKEKNYTAIFLNLFKLEKKIKAIKDKILRDIKNLFQHEEKE